MILIRDELASANSLRAQVSLSSLIIVKYVMIDFALLSLANEMKHSIVHEKKALDKETIYREFPPSIMTRARVF